ncbi:MAG TPA: oxidoreductase [Ktedonobacteraceae bacterium]|nr:oxidoreductase [Ktedonobacteraceae bacterium]
MESHPVALITGASSGIGQATAELLATHGFTVFGTSRSPEKLTRTYQLLPLDVRSDTSVEAVVQSVLEQAGRIDVLINNAGYAQVGAIEESSITDIQAQLDTNLFGVIRMIKAVLPVMRQQGSGRIINVSSVVGHISPPFAGVYSTSKFALEGLSDALREEVRPFGIDVSLVEPSFVKTHIVSGHPTNPIAAYTLRREAARQSLNKSIEKGMKAGAVAQVILRAATTRPRLRYLVGQDAKVLMLLKRVLPGSLFEGLLRRIFQTENTTPALAQPQKAVSD